MNIKDSSPSQKRFHEAKMDLEVFFVIQNLSKWRTIYLTVFANNSKFFLSFVHNSFILT